MSAQKREPRKNYIGLLSRELEEEGAAETRSATDRRMHEYLRYLMAAMSNRRSEAR